MNEPIPYARPTNLPEGYYTAQSYVGRPGQPWAQVEVFVCKCPAHRHREACARLEGICYPLHDFSQYLPKDERT